MAVSARQRTFSPRDAIQRMVDALDAEIRTMRRRSSSDWRPIGIGIRVETHPREVTYRFADVGRLDLRPGTWVRLEVDGEEQNARVEAAGKGSLTLACRDDRGPKTARARLARDASWLLDSARRELRSMSSVPRPAQLLLDPEAAQTTRALLTDGIRHAVDGLNSRQQATVRRAIGSELTYLWGPPGTGKTRTLGRIVQAFHADGQSVLLVAPTNTAVDQLLLTAAERLRGTSAVDHHRVLRVGPISSGALRRRFGDRVELDRVVRARASGPVSEEQSAAIAEVLARLRPPGSGQLSDPDALPELERRLTDDLRKIRGRAGERAGDLKEIRARLLSRASVVATTLHRAYLPGQVDRLFDAVVVDEASAAVLPMAFLAACRARSCIVVAGDFRQLPPVVRTRDSDARAWLGRDLFQVSGVVDAVERGDTPAVLSRLTTQYRMHPNICELVGGFAYGDRLMTATDRSEEISDGALPFEGARVVLIDTGPFDAVLLQGQDGRKQRQVRRRANPWHRLVVARLLEDLLGEGGSDTQQPNVAVLTPYRDQVQALRNAFGSTYPAAINTVHKAQGKEYDVVILDLPEASGWSSPAFVDR